MKSKTIAVTTLLFTIGTAATTLAQSNRVLYLDGVDDYLQIQRPVSNSFTFEIWMNLQAVCSNNATPAWCGPIYDNHYNSGDRDFGFYMAGQAPGLAVGNPWAVAPTTPVNLGSWVHLAAVRDIANTQALLYVNGSLVASLSASDAGVLNQEPTVWIGRNHRTAYLGFETRLKAYIDECRFWNTARTQTEIQTNMFRVLSGSESGLVTYLNFDANNFTDKTAYTNNATAYGSPTLVLTNIYSTGVVILASEVANVSGIGFGTFPAQWYSLSYSTNIAATNWIDSGLRILGTGATRTFFDPAGFDATKFYRVQTAGSFAPSGGSIALPKTGHTAVYQAGDDGSYQAGAAWPSPRFTTQANTNTILDNLTGLTWARNANLFGATNWSAAIVACENLTYGGQSDWRLPNVRELHSLIDYGHINPPLPSGHPFVNVQVNLYWSSTPVPGYPYAYRVDMGLSDGTISEISMTNNFPVWPVRGGL